MSPYYRDPDDNGIDLSIDNVEKADWHEWMRTQLGNNPIGVPLDPDDLARKYHAGMPEAELRRFDSSSRKLDPEMLRACSSRTTQSNLRPRRRWPGF